MVTSRSQTIRRRLGSVTINRSRVRVRAGYEFVSCQRHGDQRFTMATFLSHRAGFEAEGLVSKSHDLTSG